MSSPALQLRPSTTRTGRVVYDRPLHHFSERDVKRITGKLVQNYTGTSVISWVLQLLTDITEGLLSDILALVGMQRFAGPALRWLIDIGNWIISTVGDVFTGDYRMLMQHYASLVSDFNYQMYTAGYTQVAVAVYEERTYV